MIKLFFNMWFKYVCMWPNNLHQEIPLELYKIEVRSLFPNSEEGEKGE